MLTHNEYKKIMNEVFYILSYYVFEIWCVQLEHISIQTLNLHWECLI